MKNGFGYLPGPFLRPAEAPSTLLPPSTLITAVRGRTYGTTSETARLRAAPPKSSAGDLSRQGVPVPRNWDTPQARKPDFGKRLSAFLMFTPFGLWGFGRLLVLGVSLNGDHLDFWTPQNDRAQRRRCEFCGILRVGMKDRGV